MTRAGSSILARARNAAAVLLCAALSGAAPAGASTVSLPATTTIEQGQPAVQIPVTIDVADGVEAGDFRISYDASVVGPAGDAVTSSFTANCTPITNTSVSGLIQIGLACTMPLAGSGVLFTFPLSAVAPGAKPLTFARCDLNEDAIGCTPVAGSVVVPSPTPTATSTPTLTRTATGTATPTATATITLTPSQTRTMTSTPTRTNTRTPSATATITPIPVVHLNPIAAPILIGGSNTLSGSGFTAGSRVLLFVNNGGTVLSFGPFTPSSVNATTLVWTAPATVPLANGFGSVVVVNTDQGFIQSESQSQYLQGAAGANIPTILSINAVGLRPLDPTVPVASVETIVAPGATVTIGGSGFNAPLVNLFTAGGFVGPLSPLPGGTATSIQVTVPNTVAVGPGTFQAVNSPYSGNVVSNAVSAVIGAQLDITHIGQSGATVTVDGAGFSTLSVINLWNRQGAGAVYFGGFNAQGQPNVPLTVVSGTRFTFTVPAGAVTGPSYLQVVNPPFIPFSTTGSDPDGAFTLTVP